MDERPARRLIVIGGALSAAFDLVALLPGNPDFTSRSGLLGALAIQAFVLWGLLRRSGLAWAAAFIGSLSLPATLWLAGADWTPTEIAATFIALAQLGLLFTPPVLAYVFARDSAVASH